MIAFILDHGKIILLVLLMALFFGVLVYVFGNRKRGQRLESYGEIPFQDDDSSGESHTERSEGKRE